ncbi:glycosyltransferase [Bryobacter aggregatus]|uniref:glycosyltransferase n=1 Tax=Bryobacter aggregatus TaxID=360054 RepID=UPI000B14F68A|nr:glycosyltransferase [Bryobacter aggregatus]
MNWVILTGSYPPDEGGIADYTLVLAKRLAEAGDRVWLWSGPETRVGERPLVEGVEVLRLGSHFTPRGLLELERQLRKVPPPYRILVQYVPQAFGPRVHSRFRGLPAWFCLWLLLRKPANTTVMMHETLVSAEAGSDWRARLLHYVTRLMLRWLAKAADRIFLSTEAWLPQVLPLARPGVPVTALPVPSNVAESYDADLASQLRAEVLGDGTLLLGHFGTYREPVSDLIAKLVPHLLANDRGRHFLLIGSGSEQFRAALIAQYPELAARVTATGALSGDAIATRIGACDLMVQPYPDGVTSRRGTLMAAVALAKAVISNDGDITEQRWRDAGCIAMVDRYDPALYLERVDSLIARGAMQDLGRAGYAFYTRYCSSQCSADAIRR